MHITCTQAQYVHVLSSSSSGLLHQAAAAAGTVRILHRRARNQRIPRGESPLHVPNLVTLLESLEDFIITKSPPFAYQTTIKRQAFIF